MPSNLLETHGLAAFYGDFQALFGIDFRIEPVSYTHLTLPTICSV